MEGAGIWLHISVSEMSKEASVASATGKGQEPSAVWFYAAAVPGQMNEDGTDSSLHPLEGTWVLQGWGVSLGGSVVERILEVHTVSENESVGKFYRIQHISSPGGAN